MKIALVLMVASSTALPFALYICQAAWRGRPVSPQFIKAYAALLVMVFVLSLACMESSTWVTEVLALLFRRLR